MSDNSHVLATMSAEGMAGNPMELPDPLIELRGYLKPGNTADSIGRLANYDIISVLGQGGYGIVVKARDESLQRLVAIKLLLPRFAATSPPRKFFLREARSAAMVRQENVVQIHSVGEEPLPYLVMEYVDGETLQQRLDRTGPMESTEAVWIGRQIALGLAAAHATGLIHRDIKPANVLLERGDNPKVKITDFGIARTADDASTTQSGVIVGTPLYMSPEQVNGATIDQRTDLFSLGSVLYAMVCGHPPFRAPTSMAILKRVTEETPRPIREINPSADPALCDVINKLHAKSPAERYQSAMEVAIALDNCLLEAPRRHDHQAHDRMWRAAALVAMVSFVAITSLFAGSVARRGTASGPVSQMPAWEASIAELPPREQLAIVYDRLRQLNPGFGDPRMQYEMNDRHVTMLHLSSAQLEDISPLRALRGLRELRIISIIGEHGSMRNKLADLSPLRGLPLITLSVMNARVRDLSPLVGMPLVNLNIWDNQVEDLSPLAGLQLQFLNCGSNPLTSLAPLSGMPLTMFCANLSPIKDISPLAGIPIQDLLLEGTQVSDISLAASMPLRKLAVQGSPVTDFSVARGKPLVHLTLNFQPEAHLEWIRSIKTLEIINSVGAAEFLASPEKYRVGASK